MQSSITAWLNKQPKTVHDTDQTGRQGVSKDDGAQSFSMDDPANMSKPREHGPSKPLHFRPPFGPEHALPTAAAIVPCTLSNIEGFKRLNALLLPIPYPSKFYEEIVNDAVTASLTKLAVWDDGALGVTEQPKVVAGIRCRILKEAQNDEAESDRTVLYISTIGTLAPYRGHGLATHLLAQVARIGLEQHRARSIMAHVWEANEEGLEWYQRRGFRITRRQEDYYRRLAPRSTAIVMTKDIQPSDVAYGK